MSKADKAEAIFQTYNCAQSVLGAFAEDFGLDKDRALQTAVGFGGGMGRKQEVCGAVSGAIIALGLASEFREADGREKINAVYAKVSSLINEFTEKKGSVLCRDLLDGCVLSTEEGQRIFKEKNLRENCKAYIRLACELCEKQLAKA